MDQYMSPEETAAMNKFLLDQANGARGAGSPMGVDDLVAALTGKLEKMRGQGGTALSRALVAGGSEMAPDIKNPVAARDKALEILSRG